MPLLFPLPAVMSIEDRLLESSGEASTSTGYSRSGLPHNLRTRNSQRKEEKKIALNVVQGGTKFHL